MSSKSSSSGVSFTTLLALLFIGLKLGNVIDWSWWWVLSPLWIWFALFFGFAGCVTLFSGLIYGIAALVKAATGKSRNTRPFQ